MSLQHLHTSKSAQFYIKTGQLLTSEIEAAFARVSANATEQTWMDYETKSRRTIGGNTANISYVRFEFLAEPSFLRGSNCVEVKHAFLMIVELASLVAVFKKHVSSPIKELESKLEPISYNTLSKLFMTDDSEYERVSMQGMSMSDDVIRSRSYAAKNLQSALSPIGANRSVLKSVRVRTNGEVHGLTPSTSRIARSSGRASLSELIGWAFQVENEILGFTDSEGFIDQFAKPLKLSNIPPGVTPNGLLFTTGDLEKSVLDEQTALLVGVDSNGIEAEFNADTSRLVFDRLDKVYELAVNGNRYKFQRGELRQNRNSFSLESKKFDRIKIRRQGCDDISLTKYLNQEQAFLISYSQPQFVYYLKSVFEDRRLLGNIDAFLKVFDDSVSFNGVTSEKGALPANARNFRNNSLFARVENSIAHNHEILICDDLGDEWADHIAVNVTQSSEISFIHSKHKGDTTSASAFQDVVGQALKNLGRLFPAEATLRRKLNSWRQKYSNTNIDRIRRSNGRATLVPEILTATASPNCQRRVVLAVTFLSKAQLQQQLNNLKGGAVVKPHIIQLLWILSSFVNGCIEVGAKPEVYCRP